MAQRAIRFSETTDRRIQEATGKRGFSSPTLFALIIPVQCIANKNTWTLIHKKGLPRNRLAAKVSLLFALGFHRDALAF